MLFFVPALIFSWVYEMTSEGLRPEREVEYNSPEMINSGLKINKVVAVLLVIAIATVAADRLLPESSAIVDGSEGAADKELNCLVSVQSMTEGEPVPADRSIAVLSFMNFSDEPGAESFGDSISEQVLIHLAHTKDLQVTSRSSAFAFKDQNLNTGQLRQALNVANLVEGSVHYSEGQIRITAQLIDTSSDRILWSETYDRPLVNVLILQGQIAAEIVKAVKTVLHTGEPVPDVISPS
jgi:TolB-like protein